MALPDEILARLFAALAFTPDEAAVRLTGRLGRAAVNSALAPAGWHARLDRPGRAANEEDRLNLMGQAACQAARPGSGPHSAKCRERLWRRALDLAVTEDEALALVEGAPDIVGGLQRSPWTVLRTGSPRLAAWAFGLGGHAHIENVGECPLRAAVESGRLAMVQWVVERAHPRAYRRKLIVYRLRQAGRLGHFDIARYLADSYKVARSELTGGRYSEASRACRGGHLAYVKWIVATFGPLRGFEPAFETSGFVDADEELGSVFVSVCGSGHLEVARWMAERLGDDFPARSRFAGHDVWPSAGMDAWTAARQAGRGDVVAWLESAFGPGPSPGEP